MNPKLMILKVGGNVIDDPANLEKALKFFARYPGKKIFVHGGGKIASDLMTRVGIQPQMVEGRRITDAATLEIVTMVYAGLINKGIVAKLQAMECNAMGVTGADANLIPSTRRAKGAVDYGFVGDPAVERIHSGNLSVLLDAGFAPVFAPITHDGNGQLLNTNADTIASMLAMALAVNHEVDLVFCFDKSGVLTDVDDDTTVIPAINKDQYAGYKSSGVISAGMIPKLDNAFEAIERGVRSIRLCGTGALDESGTLLSGTVISEQ